MIRGSRFGKTNPLINLISYQADLGKIYLYINDPDKAKYQLLINKCECAGLKHLNDSKAFIQYSNNMDDIDVLIKQYNANKERKILIAFVDMIANMLSNKKINPIPTELFIKYLNICLVFIVQSFFSIPKNIRLNSTH